MEKYDIIIIGAGSGGLNIASFMNRVGLRVLLIDKSDRHIGGDCLNFGCVPSKAIIHVARLAQSAQRSKYFGLKVTGNIELKKAMGYVHDKQEFIRVHENASHFRKKGMDVVLGAAKFSGKDTVCVGKKEYRGKKILIATGARPRVPHIKGIERVHYLTNENIFNLKRLPKRLLVIGGGPIGMEMAQTFQRLGSQVIVLERGDKFLPKEEPEIAQVLKERLENEGITFYFNTNTIAFDSAKSIVVENTKTKKKTKISFDEVLISAGRILNIDQLDIEKAGVALDDSGRKLKVDGYLRTTNKKVYVCGDAAGSYQFTHAAELHAGVLLHNFFSPFKKKLNNDHLSWVTYTDPEIATFGLNEQTLKERKMTYERLVLNFEEEDRAIIEGFGYGKLVLYVRKDKILGGSMVAPHAGELFQELVLANSSGLKMKDLFAKIYPYPTASRVNKRIVANHYAKKLTRSSKKILRWLYH